MYVPTTWQPAHGVIIPGVQIVVLKLTTGMLVVVDVVEVVVEVVVVVVGPGPGTLVVVVDVVDVVVPGPGMVLVVDVVVVGLTVVVVTPSDGSIGPSDPHATMGTVRRSSWKKRRASRMGFRMPRMLHQDRASAASTDHGRR